MIFPMLLGLAIPLLNIGILKATMLLEYSLGGTVLITGRCKLLLLGQKVTFRSLNGHYIADGGRWRVDVVRQKAEVDAVV
jgi:hypothetical protein